MVSRYKASKNFADNDVFWLLEMVVMEGFSDYFISKLPDIIVALVVAAIPYLYLTKRERLDVISKLSDEIHKKPQSPYVICYLINKIYYMRTLDFKSLIFILEHNRSYEILRRLAFFRRLIIAIELDMTQTEPVFRVAKAFKKRSARYLSVLLSFSFGCYCCYNSVRFPVEAMFYIDFLGRDELEFIIKVLGGWGNIIKEMIYSIFMLLIYPVFIIQAILIMIAKRRAEKLNELLNSDTRTH